MNCTDVITPPAEDAGQVLARVATVLHRLHPELMLQSGQLCGSLLREAYADVATDAEANSLAQAAFGLLPDTTNLTRGEAALRLFKAARAAGFDWTTQDCRPVAPIDSYEWTDDDDKPAIPKIPGQRKSAVAAGPRGPKDQTAPGGPKSPRAGVTL